MNKKVTIEDLQAREQELRDEIKLQEKKISNTGRNIIEPLKPAVTFSDSIAHSLNSVFSLYKGFKLGYNIVSVLGLFRRKK
jgi:hypothetical protein